MKSFFRTSLFPWILGLGILLLDQATKHWARIRFSLPDGNPDYFKSIRVVGDWIQLRLVYNKGAAFGMKPQSILPFLSPTLFYALFSCAAMAFLIVYYRKLSEKEYFSRFAVVLILAGALGNLTDRLRFHRVTDLIDVGIPGTYPRWPTFNVADSSVCIGMAILLLMPFFVKKSSPTSPAQNGG